MSNDIVIRDKRVKGKDFKEEDSEISFVVKCPAEIRKVTHVKEIYNINGNDVTSEFKELICEDEDSHGFKLKSKDLDFEYKRGMIGVFTLQIIISNGYKSKSKVNVLDFIETED